MRLKINGQEIAVEEAGKLVSNSVGQYDLAYEFSEEYAEYDKVFVFLREGEDEDAEPVEVAVIGQTGSVMVPWEVLREPGGLKIGAYGLDGELVRPTVYSKRLAIVEGAAPGETAHTPTVLPWEQLAAWIGDLSALVTDNKTSLVAAINEVRGDAQALSGTVSALIDTVVQHTTDIDTLDARESQHHGLQAEAITAVSETVGALDARESQHHAAQAATLAELAAEIAQIAARPAVYG